MWPLNLWGRSIPSWPNANSCRPSSSSRCNSHSKKEPAPSLQRRRRRMMSIRKMMLSQRRKEAHWITRLPNHPRNHSLSRVPPRSLMRSSILITIKASRLWISTLDRWTRVLLRSGHRKRWALFTHNRN
jgi:hypothetical protein